MPAHQFNQICRTALSAVLKEKKRQAKVHSEQIQIVCCNLVEPRPAVDGGQARAVYSMVGKYLRLDLRSAALLRSGCVCWTRITNAENCLRLQKLGLL